MLSTLPHILSVLLFLPPQGAAGWPSPTPTSFAASLVTQDAAALYTYTQPPCAQLSGDKSVSDYMFNCPSDQTCAVGIPISKGQYWGCCKTIPIPGCVSLSCPTYTACVDSTALCSSCGPACMMNSEVLKCSVSTKPFCAVGSAFLIPQNPGQLASSSTTAAMLQYACADHPYTLTFSAFAVNSYEPSDCAPPWIETPSLLAAWSKTAQPAVGSALMEAFGNPFDKITVSANFSLSTVVPKSTCIFTPAPPTTTTTSGTVGRGYSASCCLYFMFLISISLALFF